MEGTSGFLMIMFVMIFLFHGDPDLWDKALLITHQWADAKLSP